MLLAFDTATPLVTVAVHGAFEEGPGDVLAERTSERPMKHGEQVAPLIDEVVAAVGITRFDLTAIAVGAGPGPFTGLRVGLVTARTLGHVLDVPVYAACTLDVLAVEAYDTGAVDGDFLVATDARRKEVYVASYRDGERVDGPVVRKPADVASTLPTVGEGADLYAEHFPHRVGPRRPSAGWLARAIAEERVELLDPEPLYLRRPDAVESRAPKPVS